MSSRKALAGLALVMSGLSAGAMASDNTVNFTGEIVDTPCVVAPVAGDGQIQVELNQVKSSVFTQAKDTSPDVGFTIVLDQCTTDTLKSANVTFSGSQDSNDNTLLAIQNQSGDTRQMATGVGIEIANNDGTAIPMGTAGSDISLVDGSNQLMFKAHYKSTAAKVTAGRADGQATFQIAYK